MAEKKTNDKGEEFGGDFLSVSDWEDSHPHEKSAKLREGGLVHHQDGFKKYPNKADYWSVTLAENVEIIYPDPDKLLERVRDQRTLRKSPKAELFVTVFFTGVLALFSLAAVVALVVIDGLPSPPWALLSGPSGLFLFLLALTSALLFALIRHYRKGLAHQGDDAFLCNVDEAVVLPEGTFCTVTGVIAPSQGRKAFGRDDCVLIAVVEVYKNEEIYQIDCDPFTLAGKRESLVVAPQLFDVFRLGDYREVNSDAQAWAAFVGDEISVSGHITTLPDGRRALSGYMAEIGFPLAPYLNERLEAESQSLSPQGFYQAPLGPAVVVVK